MWKNAARFVLVTLLGCLSVIGASAQDMTQILPLFTVTLNGQPLTAGPQVTSDGYLQVMITENVKQPTNLVIEVSEGGPSFSLKSLSLAAENFGQENYYASEEIKVTVVGALEQPLPKQVFEGMIAPNTWLGIKFGTVNSLPAAGGANTSCFNLRVGPGKNYASVHCLSLGTELTVLGREGDWVKVQYMENVFYVFHTYITNTTVVNQPTGTYVYWDGYDLDASGCTAGNPQSCESFSLLTTATKTEAQVKTCLSNAGVSNPTFGTRAALITAATQADAQNALNAKKPAGNQLLVCA